MTPIEAQMAAVCIRNYLTGLLGETVNDRFHHLYGAQLAKEMGKKPKKGMPLFDTLKNPEEAKRLKQLVRLYRRIYREAVPMDVGLHPFSGRPCSYDQAEEAMVDWLAR